MTVLIRNLLVIALTVLLAVHSIRVAAVRVDPYDWGAQVWSSHPQVQLNSVMRKIGTQAARGRSLNPEILDRVNEIAREVPLAPEPFLIKGALALLQSDPDKAERLFLAARGRDPRSEGARYFLAERYLRTGRLEQALLEMAALARLMPGASAQFSPSLAQFAGTHGAITPLRSFFRSSPEFEAPVLIELAKSERNADLIFALWSGTVRTGDPDWRPLLITQLIEKGQYEKAQQVWVRSTGYKTGGRSMFNPEFKKLRAPPPFNWTLATKGGVAEPSDDGGLRVVYYGREDATLAEQMLLLRPGTYQLAMGLAGTPSDQALVHWSVSCLTGNQSIADVPLRPTQTTRRVGARFAVPPSCPAQRLRLIGELGEFPRSAEFTIHKFQLIKASDK